jgi:REP-associated tyrosine transposase
MEVRFKEIIVEVIAEKGAWLIEMETRADRVHLLVKAIKGRSSRVLREEFPWLMSKLPSLWTNSYFVATVGGAPLSVITWYVETPKNR